MPDRGPFTVADLNVRGELQLKQSYAPTEAMAQQINFIKNIAIIGGMLMVMAFGPGRYSVDRD